MVCSGRVTIADWPHSTTQPGDQLCEIFTRMGATVEFVDGGMKLTGGQSIHWNSLSLHELRSMRGDEGRQNCDEGLGRGRKDSLLVAQSKMTLHEFSVRDVSKRQTV